MKNGLYRNRVGAELHVTNPVIGSVGRHNTLGSIYEAEGRDSLFGITPYLVTEASMADCGYELIEEVTP